MARSRHRVARRIFCFLKSPVICGRHRKRPEVRTGDVIGNKARGAETMVEDFDLNLAAMSVAGKRELDAELGGPIESVGIVREKDVGHVAANQRREVGKHL